MPSILLTRPRVASEKLAATLKAYGFDSVIEPLLTITPLTAPLPRLAGIRAVTITSANALFALRESGADIEGLLGLPCFCVGAHTGEEARAFGFRDVHTGEGGGAELTSIIRQTLKADGAILHIAGRDIDAGGSEALQRAGYTVQIWTVYDATTVSTLSPATTAKLQAGDVQAAPVFSARTAAVLALLLQRQGLVSCCESMIAIGISPAVAQVLAPLPWRKCLAAPKPSEDAVIATLRKALS